MADYSFLLGIWKSIKNTVIVLAPALIAGWAAFEVKLPPEQNTMIMAIAGFLVYLLKNYIQVKKE